MSYHSFKRVLGETSLERKCRFLFGGCLLFLITGSFWWTGSRNEELVYAQGRRNDGRAKIDKVMIQSHWKYFKVPRSEQSFIDQLAKTLQSDRKYTTRILKPEATDKENQPQNDFEEAVLERFVREPIPDTAALNGPPEYAEQLLRDKQEYRYFQPIRLREECMECHAGISRHLVLGAAGLPSPPPPVKGELMAVVEIILPDAETQKALNWNRAILISTAIITVFMAMLASYVIVRYVIVKPLKHLRDVSEQVSRGNIEARAEIHTADEFEELGTAFNKMLRHLSAARMSCAR